MEFRAVCMQRVAVSCNWNQIRSGQYHHWSSEHALDSIDNGRGFGAFSELEELRVSVVPGHKDPDPYAKHINCLLAPRVTAKISEQLKGVPPIIQNLTFKLPVSRVLNLLTPMVVPFTKSTVCSSLSSNQSHHEKVVSKTEVTCAAPCASTVPYTLNQWVLQIWRNWSGWQLPKGLYLWTKIATCCMTLHSNSAAWRNSRCSSFLLTCLRWCSLRWWNTFQVTDTSLSKRRQSNVYWMSMLWFWMPFPKAICRRMPAALTLVFLIYMIKAEQIIYAADYNHNYAKIVMKKWRKLLKAFGKASQCAFAILPQCNKRCML